MLIIGTEFCYHLLYSFPFSGDSFEPCRVVVVCIASESAVLVLNNYYALTLTKWRLFTGIVTHPINVNILLFLSVLRFKGQTTMLRSANFPLSEWVTLKTGFCHILYPRSPEEHQLFIGNNLQDPNWHPSKMHLGGVDWIVPTGIRQSSDWRGPPCYRLIFKTCLSDSAHSDVENNTQACGYLTSEHSEQVWYLVELTCVTFQQENVMAFIQGTK